MEFLRFGSSIPGTYYGCCAVCIIQQFNVDPDDKASIQLVDGDGGTPLGDRYAGPTYRDIFNQRLRIGTFSERDMPNHTFLAVLTEYQLSTGHGKRWLAILKESGFEFIRTVDNSVYTGQSLLGEASYPATSRKNYLFGLFRNIGNGAVENPFTPPKEWTDLPSVLTEPYLLQEDSQKDLVESARKAHLEVWNRIGKPTWLTREEVIAAGAPVILAGKRSYFPQQTEKARQQAEEQLKGSKDTVATLSSVDPFDFYDDYEDDDCGDPDCEICG